MDSGAEIEELRKLELLQQQLDQDPRPACPFFAKVGACRYGPTCSRAHFYPPESTTMLIQNMHQDALLIPKGRTLALEDEELADEVDEKQLHDNFLEFFNDTHEEFQRFGSIVQFKVCRNVCPHLRGNVYVQYSKPSETAEAIKTFNGRFFGGVQLACFLVNVPSWKQAICGTSRCPKGEMCNFLHVFRNPNGLYKDADYDFEELDRRRGGGRGERGDRKDDRERDSRDSRDRRDRDREREGGERDRDRGSRREPYGYREREREQGREREYDGDRGSRYIGRGGARDEYRPRVDDDRRRDEYRKPEEHIRRQDEYRRLGGNINGGRQRSRSPGFARRTGGDGRNEPNVDSSKKNEGGGGIRSTGESDY
ncbi:UNVERIFIED_CONTAM: U2 small nuclear ribonucleoprotein auxiliary factor 35 kDa subunit- protein 2 [Siphonaria sp. JEL0065]|nr:U2 small nuclear ribonucleoprotein auxiliary factor 35 kDa subunit- protein 2 [Siphonaria sp. JEL0065]